MDPVRGGPPPVRRGDVEEEGAALLPVQAGDRLQVDVGDLAVRLDGEGKFELAVFIARLYPVLHYPPVVAGVDVDGGVQEGPGTGRAALGEGDLGDRVGELRGVVIDVSHADHHLHRVGRAAGEDDQVPGVSRDEVPGLPVHPGQGPDLPAHRVQAELVLLRVEPVGEPRPGGDGWSWGLLCKYFQC